MHHAGFKQILEKLVVIDSATCLDFENEPLLGMECINFKCLGYLATAPK